jgi:hypothetical protein
LVKVRENKKQKSRVYISSILGVGRFWAKPKKKIGTGEKSTNRETRRGNRVKM